MAHELSIMADGTTQWPAQTIQRSAGTGTALKAKAFKKAMVTL